MQLVEVGAFLWAAACPTCAAVEATINNPNVTSLTFTLMSFLQYLIGCALASLWILILRDSRRPSSAANSIHNVVKVLPADQVEMNHAEQSEHPLHQKPFACAGIATAEHELTIGSARKRDVSDGWRRDGYQARDVIQAAAQVCG